jgi:predicted nucleic acid-binding protein
MTIDTNIIIAYLAGEDDVIDFLDSWRMQGGFLYLPTIVEAEVLSFSKWTTREYNTIAKFLEENFISVPFDRQVAQLAAKLRKTYSMKLPDAAIAASALIKSIPLMTRNLKDFKKVKNLEIIEI